MMRVNLIVVCHAVVEGQEPEQEDEEEVIKPMVEWSVEEVEQFIDVEVRPEF